MKKPKYCILIMSILISFLCVSNISVSASENEEDTVTLGGNPFGIKMFTEGVIVIKTESVKGKEGAKCPADEAGIKANDIIISANDKKLRSNEELSEIIENSQGNTITLSVKREERTFEAKLNPCKNNQGVFKAGMWIKDSAAGIGTITFFSEELGSFCGLGHGICDNDTGMLIPLSYGEVQNAYIASVTKSNNGKVGTLNGYFTNNTIGTAEVNIESGIYGKTTCNITGNQIEIADDKEVKTGQALIYTTVSGQTPQYYDAEIIKVNSNNYDTDIVIKITDKELVEITGGIVQGMSGSPIIQNHKLVGAITHVIVDNTVCGYGIFAERMMDALEERCS